MLRLAPLLGFCLSAALLGCSEPSSTATLVSAPVSDAPPGASIPASALESTPANTAGVAASGNFPRELSTRELLEASNAAMRAVESAHLVYEATTEVGDQVSLFVGIEGDYQAPDRFRYSMSTGFGPVSGSLRYEYTMIGTRAFLKDPESGVWRPDPAAQNPFVFFSLDGGPPEGLAINFDPGAFEGFTVAEGELDGESVYHLRGNPSDKAYSDSLDAIRMAVLGQTPEGAAEGGLPEGNVEIEYWIGTEDFLARRVRGLFEVSGQDHTGESITLKSEVILVLSDYGKPVDIRDP